MLFAASASRVCVSVCVCVHYCFYSISLSEFTSMCLYLCIIFIFSLSPALDRTSALNWPLNAAHSATGSLSYKCRETKRAQAASKRVGDISGFRSSKHYLLLYFLFENNYTVYKFIYMCVCIYFCRESPLSEKSRV